QDRSAEATEVIRQGLQQIEAQETFLALADALRLCRDRRFVEELLAALSTGRPAVRQAAAESFAVGADRVLVRRLQAIAENVHADLAVRQSALIALGGTGRKAAVEILIQQLASDQESLRQSAADGLERMTGQPFGLDGERWQTWWKSHRDL